MEQIRGESSTSPGRAWRAFCPCISTCPESIALPGTCKIVFHKQFILGHLLQPDPYKLVRGPVEAKTFAGLGDLGASPTVEDLSRMKTGDRLGTGAE